jgi:hypothetical protein
MSNLAKWIEATAEGEPIEAVVIGQMGWGDYGSDDVPRYAEQPKSTILTWEQARPWLDYEFDGGFGAPGCNAIHAWTANRVIYISQYDGATSANWVPRHPSAVEPTMPGG